MLEKKLIDYSKSNIYPFHMPGHKRRLESCNPYELDITEIEGFDNLHHSEGVLKEAQDKAAKLYGSKKAYYLVNGSTCGILAAISAATRKGDKVIVARNSHKAVYNALYLNELKPTYIFPRITRFGLQGQITVEDVQQAIEQTPDAKAVIITSPTYDGITSDVCAIAKIVHEKNMILIVDSAHGAHFGFGYGMPQNVIKQGADIAIESVHKTLPAYTQTAILHLCSDRVRTQDIERYLGIYETSSPSYVLMAGIERAINLVETQKENLFGSLEDNLDRFYSKVNELKYLKVLTREELTVEEACDFDRSKIIILTTKAGISGQDMWDILLEKYGIQIEMAAGNYAVALSSIMDTKEGFDRLADALIQIDDDIDNRLINNKTINNKRFDADETINRKTDKIINASIYHPNEKKLEIHQADEYDMEEIPLDEATGKVSGAYINLYPPGIPLIVPGEIISERLISDLQMIKALDLELQGLTENNFITILKG